MAAGEVQAGGVAAGEVQALKRAGHAEGHQQREPGLPGT